VQVSLGVDWNPTGSNTMFDEFRVADKVNDEQWGGAIPTEDWLKMITVIPAKALALDDYIGILKAGLKADVRVLKSKETTPGKSLLMNHLEDVEMVWVGGNLLYGDEPVVEKIKSGLCEPLTVHGSRKRVCVKNYKDSKDKKGQTLGEIQGALQTAYPALAPLAP
jgi:Cytosine deaminase and related metal-dependent hydrolases